MVDVELEKARALISTARNAFDSGDIAGVAGLAYQAVESAFVVIIDQMNGLDPGKHSARSKRAEELLVSARNKTQSMWKARNIDFYGNVELGGRRRRLTPKMARETLETAEQVIEEVEALLKEGR